MNSQEMRKMDKTIDKYVDKLECEFGAGYHYLLNKYAYFWMFPRNLVDSNKNIIGCYKTFYIDKSRTEFKIKYLYYTNEFKYLYKLTNNGKWYEVTKLEFINTLNEICNKIQLHEDDMERCYNWAHENCNCQFMKYMYK